MVDVLTRFDKGQPVPEWLLVCEPITPGSPRGLFVFGTDCYIIDTPEAYLAVGIQPRVGALVDLTGTLGHRIYAPDKTVCVVETMSTFQTLASQNWVHAGAAPAAPLREQVRRGDRWGQFFRGFFGRA